MRLRIPTSRVDATAITTATTIAGLGIAGVRFEHLPVERIGELADVLAGGFAFRHWFHGRKHSHTTEATIRTEAQ